MPGGAGFNMMRGFSFIEAPELLRDCRLIRGELTWLGYWSWIMGRIREKTGVGFVLCWRYNWNFTSGDAGAGFPYLTIVAWSKVNALLSFIACFDWLVDSCPIVVGYCSIVRATLCIDLILNLILPCYRS